MFPAEQLGPAVLKAWRAVLRPPLALVPVGGITPDNLSSYARAGASGFGLGSALYKPGLSANEVGRNARAFSSPPGNAPIPPRRPKREDHSGSPHIVPPGGSFLKIETDAGIVGLESSPWSRAARTRWPPPSRNCPTT